MKMVIQAGRQLTDEIVAQLSTIEFYLKKLTDAQYRQPLDILSGASVGAHTRHVLEFYQCLQSQLSEGIIDYELRKHDTKLQEQVDNALDAIFQLKSRFERWLPANGQSLLVMYPTPNGEVIVVKSSLERELVYNIEHQVHHLAMIKIGLKVLEPHLVLPDNFGVAASTQRHQYKTRSQEKT